MARRWLLGAPLLLSLALLPGAGAEAAADAQPDVFEAILALLRADNDTQHAKGSSVETDARSVKAIRDATPDKVAKGTNKFKFRLRRAHVELCEWLSRHQPQNDHLRLPVMRRAVDELKLFASPWQWAEAYHEDIAAQGAPYFTREAARARWPELAEAIDELEAQVIPVLAAEYDKAVEVAPKMSQEHPEGLHTQGHWSLYRLLSEPLPRGRCPTKVFPGTCEVLKEFDKKIVAAKRGRIQEARFATLHPGSKVVRHTATSNQRLKVHCGIHNPDNVELLLTDTKFVWKRGECIIIDDSFEHELQSSPEQRHRTILELKIEHPDLVRFGYIISEENGKRIKFSQEL